MRFHGNRIHWTAHTVMNANASDVKNVIDVFYNKKDGFAKGRALHINTGLRID